MNGKYIHDFYKFSIIILQLNVLNVVIQNHLNTWNLIWFGLCKLKWQEYLSFV